MGDDYSVRLLRRLTHTPLALKVTLGDKLYDAYISSMLTPFSIDEVRLMERKTLYHVRTQCGDDKTFYRFGFNGQEKDNELKGKGNVNTAEFWEYDTRFGRRWNIDPVDQVSISNYAVMGDNPVWKVDPLGNFNYKSNASTKSEQKKEIKLLKQIAKDFKNEVKSYSQEQKDAVLAETGYTNWKDFMKNFKNGEGPTLQFGEVNEGEGRKYASDTYGETKGDDITLSVDLKKIRSDLNESLERNELYGAFSRTGTLKKGERNTFLSLEKNAVKGFTNRIMLHEMAHYGAGQNERIDLPPSLVTNPYERGFNLERKVYNGILDYDGCETGVGVYNHYIHFKNPYQDNSQIFNDRLKEVYPWLVK